MLIFLISFSFCKKEDTVQPLVPPENLPDPHENVIIVSNVPELEAAVIQANKSGNITIMFKDGTYQINEMVYITADNVDFRSQSGNRDAVILKGAGTTGNVGYIFNVAGKNFIVGNLTLGWVRYHGIQFHGEMNADNPLIHNVKFVDTGEQMLKVSFSSGNTAGCDNGIVQYCLFEYPSGMGPQYYIGGVDAHQAANWQVRYNTFKNIRSPEADFAEHAIHFWSFSSNTIVEGNTIINCDRGIGFGMGTSGHNGGIIKNNMIYTSRDVGIGLENANNVEVYNNSVYSGSYPYSIEYRFGNTHATISNNLTDRGIQQRDGATAVLQTNYTNVSNSVFKNATQGDLHLNQNLSQITDAGTNLNKVSIDFDKEERPKGSGVDIGADEAF
jgi:hypothetical protein